MLVSASQYARMCGVSAMAICKQIQAGQLVRVSGGKKLDTDEPVNRAYLEKKQAKMKAQLEVKAMEAAANGGSSTPASADALTSGNEQKRGNTALTAASAAEEKNGATRNYSPDLNNPAAEILRNQLAASQHKSHDMMKMTISELLRTFGSIDNIERFSKIQRDLSAADEREQRTQEKRMQQIPKDFVVQRVFGYIDDLMNQLLDVPESVCEQVIAVSLAGGDDVRINVMHILSDNLTRCISGAKEHIVGELDTLKGKYDKQSDSIMEMQEKLNEVMETV